MPCHSGRYVRSHVLEGGREGRRGDGVGRRARHAQGGSGRAPHLRSLEVIELADQPFDLGRASRRQRGEG